MEEKQNIFIFMAIWLLVSVLNKHAAWRWKQDLLPKHW